MTFYVFLKFSEKNVKSR